jgi:hypothetical protein
MSDSVIKDDTHDVSYLEQRLSLEPGAIEAQQRGERRSDLPITFNYGDVETLPKGGPQVGSAVFIINVASKVPKAITFHDLSAVQKQLPQRDPQ